MQIAWVDSAVGILYAPRPATPHALRPTWIDPPLPEYTLRPGVAGLGGGQRRPYKRQNAEHVRYGVYSLQPGAIPEHANDVVQFQVPPARC